MQAETVEVPIDVLAADNQHWILDGVHRIAKHHMLGLPVIAVRFHLESVVAQIRID